LFFRYPHFKQGNPHNGSLLVLTSSQLSTTLDKMIGQNLLKFAKKYSVDSDRTSFRKEGILTIIVQPTHFSFQEFYFILTFHTVLLTEDAGY